MNKTEQQIVDMLKKEIFTYQQIKSYPYKPETQILAVISEKVVEHLLRKIEQGEHRE